MDHDDAPVAQSRCGPRLAHRALDQFMTLLCS